MIRRLLAVIVAAFAAFAAAAHDLPTDVQVHAFVKPAGERLELLLRVPLGAMQDIDFPLRGPGYLFVSRADAALRDATRLWLIDNIELYENDRRLPTPEIVGVRVSLPSDRSFVSYERARAHLAGPMLRDDMDLFWDQQLLDVALTYPIESERAAFAIHARLDRLGARVSTALRFLPPDGAVRAFSLHGDAGLVRLDPRWHQAALSFVAAGIRHILEGLDHLLFLLCLVIPFRRLRPLIVIVTSFTVAHSIALIAAALGFLPTALWFPPLIETLIALSIVWMALENIVVVALRRERGAALPRRWIIAFAFGLVHGFGFSFALAEQLQFAGDHLVTALLGFNLGVELGQLAVILVLIPALGLVFRAALPERLGIIILSALVAHTGWHWMVERGEALAKFPLPTLDAAFLTGALRALIAALILAGLVALAHALLRRWIEPRDLPHPSASSHGSTIRARPAK